MKTGQKEKLTDRFGDNVKLDCSLDRYTSFVIGGPAAALVVVDDEKDLRDLLVFCDEQSLNWRVIGGGTNLLVNDSGYDGIIIHLGEGFKTATHSEADPGGRVLVEAGCGFGFSRLSDWCADRGISGLEFAAGIPGSLGGAVVMNAGAWGSEIAGLITAIRLVDRSGNRTVEAEKLDFDYRCLRTIVESAKKQVIVKAFFRLRHGSIEGIKERCRQLRKKRKESQPYSKPTCGSFFKNPPNHSAGRLIDACGLKGTQIGGAMISTKHANFFINNGNATAADMKQLMELVQNRVNRAFNILLEPEVHFLP